MESQTTIDHLRSALEKSKLELENCMNEMQQWKQHSVNSRKEMESMRYQMQVYHLFYFFQ